MMNTELRKMRADMVEMLADIARLSEILGQRRGEDMLAAARRVVAERDALQSKQTKETS
jgi:hypothetical protein